MRKFIYSMPLAWLLLSTTLIFAQKPTQLNSAEIYHQLNKLNRLGRVLYLAAHPDDENQRIITYFDNEAMLDAAYLSLTRGDGGQNLVGPEIRESLGIIRTQELLEARKIDGGEQFFTRANDFGYSKTADETLEIWDKSKILGDVVWVIRKFRPDVIITRFPPDDRAGHGHHTSSAVLAKAAFELSNDPAMYPEQLKYVEVWQPKRIFVNTGRWWNDTMTKDTPGIVSLDVGDYNQLLGESYTEIAARSRTAHKSQGFGSTGNRGEQLEFLELLMGEPAKDNALDGVDVSWNRIGRPDIADKMKQTIDNYNFDDPSASVEQLLEVRNLITQLEDVFWKQNKLKAIDALILQCAGVYIEMLADNTYATAGAEVKVKLEMINRSGLDVRLDKFSLDQGVLANEMVGQDLSNNQKVLLENSIIISDNMEVSQPYWLKEKGTPGTYNVKDQLLIGTPENTPAIVGKAVISVEGQSINIEVPLTYKWNDPVKGEQYKPFVILPEVALNISEPVFIFNNNTQSKDVEVVVKSFQDSISATVAPRLSKGWKSVPENVQVTLKNGEEQVIQFAISAPKNQAVEEMLFTAMVGDKIFDQSYIQIEYDHINTQTYLPKATSQMVKLDVEIKGKLIGYFHGAGDNVPEALSNMGYEVHILEEQDVNDDDLKKYDAILLGLRTLNTNERIDFVMPTLLKYVENGGNLIVQYNTNHSLKTSDYAPFDLNISRDRVSEENAEVRILQPNHEVLNYPNKITIADFDGWVQERGLYFPNSWSSEYQAILSMNDKTEDPKDGSLLVTKYGKGNYVYTGISFFRELPAGVPGAYRLLANIVSLGKNDK